MSDTSSDTQRRERANPESFRARTLTASFTVNDLTKSLAWYTDVLGFTIDRKHERDGQVRAVSLKAGDVRILLGQDDGAKGMDRQKGVGSSIMLGTAQNVDDLAARIKERGGVLATEPTTMPWGARAFRIEDPDGFKIAISSV
jgi:uncharacterized glyoxalase superfamily protein PhnB